MNATCMDMGLRIYESILTGMNITKNVLSIATYQTWKYYSRQTTLYKVTNIT